MIYLRTEDHEGFRSLKRGRGAIQWAGGGGAAGEGEGGAEEGAGSRGWGGEEELCVMSVFPRLSYFEM